jgi:hypothetical protein
MNNNNFIYIKKKGAVLVKLSLAVFVPQMKLLATQKGLPCNFMEIETTERLFNRLTIIGTNNN